MKTGLLVSVLILCVLFPFMSSAQQDRPYFNLTETGLSFGQVKTWNDQSDTRVNFSFQTINGVHIDSKNAIGLLLGIDSYPRLILAPIGFGWRGSYGKPSKNRLLLGLDMGYGSAFLEKRVEDQFFENWYEGGFMISPSIGWRFKGKSGKRDYALSVAFRRQHAYYYEGVKGEGGNQPGLPPGFTSIREESYVFNSLISRFGIFF